MSGYGRYYNAINQKKNPVGCSHFDIRKTIFHLAGIILFEYENRIKHLGEERTQSSAQNASRHIT